MAHRIPFRRRVRIGRDLELVQGARLCDVYERRLPLWFEAMEMAFFALWILVTWAFEAVSPRLDR